jgi:DNA-binding transcriptional LysR family regulator
MQEGFSSMKDLPAFSWDDLRIAAAAARLGSLSAVARRTGLSVATVGRRLDRLEQALGVTLFHRGSGGLTTRPEAAPLLEHADGVADRIADLVRSATAGQSRAEGRITLTTLDVIVSHVIAPRLAELRREHPGIELVLRSTPRIERLDRRAADLAVRIMRPNEPRLVGKKLGTQHLALFASPDYVARKGKVNPRDLRGHDVVKFEPEWDAVPEMRWLAERMGDTEPVFRVNSLVAMVEIVRSGAAIGILPTSTEGDGLDRVRGAEPVAPRDLWLVMHEDLRRAKTVRAVADFLVRIVPEQLARSGRV